MKNISAMFHILHTQALRIALFLMAPSIFTPAMAVDATDLTQDQSGGKTFSDAFTNMDTLRQEGSTFIIGISALLGIIIIIVSLLSLHNASKDDTRETPKGAIVGLIVGGCLAAAAAIMWMMANTVTGA